MDLALLTGQRPADVLKLKRTDIRDGALRIIQNKTDARLGIGITGELEVPIARINERPRKAISAYIIQVENGQPLTQCALSSRFDNARTPAKVDFQFRDIRAKAATNSGDSAHSQTLLGHKNRDSSNRRGSEAVAVDSAYCFNAGLPACPSFALSARRRAWSLAGWT